MSCTVPSLQTWSTSRLAVLDGRVWLAEPTRKPCAGSGVVRIDPLHFLAECRTRQLKPGLASSCLSYNLCFIVLLFIRAPFYVLLIFVAVCSVFWLFCCHYLPSDWLERPLWGSLIVARGLSPESPGRRVRIIFWFIVLLHCFIMYLCCLLPLREKYPTVFARL